MKKIGIVTVLYNSSAVIKEFFQTLGEQNYKNMILYVVDNNSTDDSLQVCKEYENFLQIPVKYIINNENYGVAKGNNIGIKEAFNDNCDYILLSNNDIKL
ncbi:MAG: glycosyltransferase, partial [Lachnospiraceae bacterium]|nr:glycosyltransferase [Lachnospiraceae bacterium]